MGTHLLILLLLINVLLLVAMIGIGMILKRQSEHLSRLDEQARKLCQEAERHTMDTTSADGDQGGAV